MCVIRFLLTLSLCNADVDGGRLKAIIKPRSIPILKNRLFFAADAQLSRTSLSFFGCKRKLKI